MGDGLVSGPTQFQKLRGEGQPARTQDNVGAVLNPLAQAVGKTPIMGAPPPPWIRAALLNGFAELDSPYPPTSFHRDALGYVHARVSIQHAAGAATVDVMEFPQGYRPDSSMLVTGSDGAGVFFEFTLDESGVLQNITTFAAGDAAQFSFTFLAVF